MKYYFPFTLREKLFPIYEWDSFTFSAVHFGKPLVECYRNLQE